MRIFKKFLIPILSLSLFAVSCSSNEEPTTPVDNTGVAPPTGEYTATNTFYKGNQTFTNISTVIVAVTGDICKITANEVIVRTYLTNQVGTPESTFETNSSGLELTINKWENPNKSADNGGTNKAVFGEVTITKPNNFIKAETIEWNYTSADKTNTRLLVIIRDRDSSTYLYSGTKEISFTGYKSL